jgi:hypothetical protein
MKKGILLTWALSAFLLLSLILAASSFAQQAKAKSARQQKIEEERRAREEAERAAKRREMEKKIKQDLQQLKEWVVYLIPTGSNPAKQPIKKDILTFTDISVSSEYLAERKFGSSNYALSANDDGLGVWETMQRNDKGDVAFWKGEVRDTAMRGALGLQPKKGQMQEFTFTTEKPAGYIEPAPKKEDVKAKKGEVEAQDEGKVSRKTKN